MGRSPFQRGTGAEYTHHRIMRLLVFDLTRFQVISDGTNVYLRATVRNLIPTFGVTDGAQLLDVYVHVPGASPTSTAAPFASRNPPLEPAAGGSGVCRAGVG